MSALGLGISFHKRRILPASGGKLTYPGLIAAWSAAGKSNDDADRSVLRDLTGNGHDITLNNFAFSEMSGYGGYVESWYNWTGAYMVSRTNHKLELYIRGASILNCISPADRVPNFRVKITGLDENNAYIQIGNAGDLITFAEHDGVYLLDADNFRQLYPTQSYIGIKTLSKDNNVTYPIKNIITLELLPEYPDALVFDGVDDYGINEEMPILTDYTVIVKRKYLSGIGDIRIPLSYSRNTTSGNSAVFWFELLDSRCVSFGKETKDINILASDVSYQTKYKYNGSDINIGLYIPSEAQTLALGFTANRYFTNMAFYSAYLFDRSLDEQEIKSFIRKYIDADYLLPSEIPTPDCYYDFTNGDNASETRDTIVDLSGNGNDAKAYNFSWNEEGSGYKDGALQFDGVDDYVKLEAFDSGFKTFFIKCNILKIGSLVFDQKAEPLFRLYNTTDINYIAYNNHNNKGQTYINGILNTKLLATDLINKSQIICLINNVSTLLTGYSPVIGASVEGDRQYTKMSLYKFLGFKEALTEEQIQYVIKKYNLLDGVDEIEVS